MAKLPTALLPRSLPSTSTSSSSSAAAAGLFTCSASHRPTFSSSPSTTSSSSSFLIRPTQQVRHATRVERPKRPFTWTQIIQLSDGSTFTSRSTAPVSVYRSNKDTRNHARWQPTEISLQNVEVDEAGKLASFRKRFGGAFDLAPVTKAAAAAEAVKEKEETIGRGIGKGGSSKKKAEELKKIEEEKKAAEAAAAAAVEEDDIFTDLLSSFVVDQPHLKGGRLAGKAGKEGKKGKKK